METLINKIPQKKIPRTLIHPRFHFLDQCYLLKFLCWMFLLPRCVAHRTLGKHLDVLLRHRPHLLFVFVPGFVLTWTLVPA